MQLMELSPLLKSIVHYELKICCLSDFELLCSSEVLFLIVLALLQIL